MANNLRKFNTYSDYEAAELVKPAVSLIAATDEVYFDQKEAPVPPTPSDLCRLTLDNGETVDIEGSGELTQEMISAYTGTCVSAEIGTACTSIGDSAFDSCSSLTNINIPNSVTSIEGSAFGYCSGLTGITIPDSVTSIGMGAFSDCSSLISCTIGSGVTSIGDGAFGSCSGLTSITIPDSVTSIGNYVFDNCTSLTRIDIPSGVTSIGDGAFGSCSGLTSCTIGSGVTTIGEEVFNGCTGLTSIKVNAIHPPQLGRYAFENTNDCPIYVPRVSVNDYRSASDWSDYADRIQAIP